MSKALIKTISIPIELQEFLDKNTDLSLSKMCQSKIIEIRESRNLLDNEEAKSLRIQIKTRIKEIDNLWKFIESKKLDAECMKFLKK